MIANGALELGIVDLVQQQYGMRPLLSTKKAQRLSMLRFSWLV